MQQTVACRWIILDDTKLLVVSFGPQVDWRTLPWGRLDLWETLHECVHRELIEELGVQPTVGHVACVAQIYLEQEEPPVHFFHFLYHIHNASDFREVDRTSASHAHELDAIKRIDIFDDDTIVEPRGLLPWLRANYPLQPGPVVLL